MSLAEKIEKIRTDQENTKKQFMNEVFQGLQQLHAYKTQEEVEAQRKVELEDRTVTGSSLVKTDTGETKTTTYESGRERKDTVTDERTPEPKEPTYKEIKSGNEIITYQNGKEISRAPRWKPEQLKAIKGEKKSKAILELEDEVRDLETDIATYRQEVASAKPDENETEGVYRGSYFFPTSDIILDINKAQGKIRKKREQIEKLSTRIDKKIEKKFGKQEEASGDNEKIDQFMKTNGITDREKATKILKDNGMI